MRFLSFLWNLVATLFSSRPSLPAPPLPTPPLPVTQEAHTPKVVQVGSIWDDLEVVTSVKKDYPFELADEVYSSLGEVGYVISLRHDPLNDDYYVRISWKNGEVVRYCNEEIEEHILVDQPV